MSVETSVETSVMEKIATHQRMTHHDIAAFIIEIQWEQMVALQRYYSAVWVVILSARNWQTSLNSNQRAM